MPEKSCSHCGISASQVREADPKAKPFYCGECIKIARKVVYCSRNCQLEARSSHRPTCGKAVSHSTSPRTFIPTVPLHTSPLPTSASSRQTSSADLLDFIHTTDSLSAIRDASGVPISIEKARAGVPFPAIVIKMRDTALATNAPADVANWFVSLARRVGLLVQLRELVVEPQALIRQMEDVFGTTRKAIVEALLPLVATSELALFRPYDTTYAWVSQLGGSYSTSGYDPKTRRNVFIPSLPLAHQCSALAADVPQSVGYFIFPPYSSSAPIPLAMGSSTNLNDLAKSFFLAVCNPTAPDAIGSLLHMLSRTITALFPLQGEIKKQIEELCQVRFRDAEREGTRMERNDVGRKEDLGAWVMHQLMDEFGADVCRKAMMTKEVWTGLERV